MWSWVRKEWLRIWKKAEEEGLVQLSIGVIFIIPCVNSSPLIDERETSDCGAE